MVQLRAVPNFLTSLAEVEKVYGITASQNPDFSPEWTTQVADLAEAEQARLDTIKRRYLLEKLTTIDR